MRFLVVAIVTLALVPGLVGTALSAGYQVVGKEPCNCSPLVARGIYPDTLNKLHDAVYFPTVLAAVDQVAMDLKSVVTHLAAAPAEEAQESGVASEDVKAAPQKSTTEEKIQKEEKAKEAPPAAVKKKAKKKTTHSNKRSSKKHKKIKVPPSQKEEMH